MLLDQVAPDFGIYNTEKQKIILSELKGGNVVLLFFPLAFTSTCTKELCGVRDNLTFYNGVNATVFGISVDTPHTLKKFKEELQLNFELLSDFNKSVSQDYNTMYETFVLELKGVSKRSAFVIDKQGMVRYEEILENAGDVPNFEAINKVLQTLN